MTAAYDPHADWRREDREATFVHVLSAAAVYTDATRTETSHVAMCGELMGDYTAACNAGHQVGNYLVSTSPYYALVTCPGCRVRMSECWARQRRGY